MMKATIVCVCGRMQTAKEDNADKRYFTLRGWAYVRDAKGDNKANGFTFEGLCSECQGLDEEDE